MKITLTLEVARHREPPTPAAPVPTAPQVDVKHASSLERAGHQPIGFQIEPLTTLPTWRAAAGGPVLEIAKTPPPPPPPPPPPVTVRNLLEDAPDTSWVKMVRLDHAHRGRIVPPSARGRGDHHECVVPPIELEGTTWDCPACGRVWIVERYRIADMLIRPVTFVWARASWRTARAHRRAR